MIDLLFFPAIFLYAGSSLVFLIMTGVLLKRVGHNPLSWVLIGLSVLWGSAMIWNVYIVTYVPSSFPANFQGPYTVLRGAAVLVYIGFAVASALRKSPRLLVISQIIALVIIGDLIASLVGGRYVGP